VRDSQADIKKINTDDLINEIKKNGVKAHNTQSIEQTADIIKKDYKKYDIIVTMGAGDINKIYKYL
jgi:UDP-N-acetylmuramate-alanine ligase